MWDDPYYILFTLIVESAIEVEVIDGDSEAVDFVFDSDEKHVGQFKLMLPPLKESIDDRFVNAVRRDEKSFLPLQAADLLAWQIRRFCEPNNEPVRKRFLAARDRPPRKHELFIMDRPRLLALAKKMRETGAKFAA
jgi:hypothetical protein